MRAATQGSALRVPLPCRVVANPFFSYLLCLQGTAATLLQECLLDWLSHLRLMELALQKQKWKQHLPVFAHAARWAG